MRYRTPLFAFLALAGLLLYSTGCDSASNPVAPTGSVLTVTANPTFVGLSGSSTITISGFKPDGNPLNPGTQINLSTSQGAIPSLVVADDSGRATATFTADERVGTATVTASLPGNEATATAMVEIGEQRPVLEISSNPSTVAVGKTATVTVVARDFNGFALPNDGPIVLTAANGTIPRQVFTNSSGVAEGEFQSTGDGSANGSVSAFLRNSETVQIEIVIRDAVSSIDLTLNTRSVERQDPPGDTVNLLAIVRNAQGNPVQSISVTFIADVGSLSQVSVPTNAQGQAASIITVTANDLINIQENGTFTVTAQVTSEGLEFKDVQTITVIGSP